MLKVQTSTPWVTTNLVPVESLGVLGVPVVPVGRLAVLLGSHLSRNATKILSNINTPVVCLEEDGRQEGPWQQPHPATVQSSAGLKEEERAVMMRTGKWTDSSTRDNRDRWAGLMYGRALKEENWTSLRGTIVLSVWNVNASCVSVCRQLGIGGEVRYTHCTNIDLRISFGKRARKKRYSSERRVCNSSPKIHGSWSKRTY